MRHIRDGEKGGRGYGGGGRGRLYTYRYATVATRLTSALRWAAMRAISMFHNCHRTSSVQTLQKSFGQDCKPRSSVCIRMQKDHTIRSLKILQSLSQFGGLCKHQNSPACTKSLIVFRLMNLDSRGKKTKTVMVTIAVTVAAVGLFFYHHGCRRCCCRGR